MSDSSENFLLYLPNSDSLVELDESGKISQNNQTFNLVAEEKWMTEFLVKHNETSARIKETLAELRNEIKNEEIDRIVTNQKRMDKIKLKLENLKNEQLKMKRKLQVDVGFELGRPEQDDSEARNFASNARLLSERITARKNQKKTKKFKFF